MRGGPSLATLQLLLVDLCYLSYSWYFSSIFALEEKQPGFFYMHFVFFYNCLYMFWSASYHKNCWGDIFLIDILLPTLRQDTIAIKDYLVGSLKFKVASRNLWGSLSAGAKLPCFLLSCACSLLEQVG